jgi:hypothetical protein
MEPSKDNSIGPAPTEIGDRRRTKSAKKIDRIVLSWQMFWTGVGVGVAVLAVLAYMIAHYNIPTPVALPKPGQLVGQLPAPVFSDDTPKILVPDKDEEVPVGWKSVPGAKQYRLIVKTAGEKRVTELTTKATRLYLRDFSSNAIFKFSKERHYTVSLASIDEFGQEGPEGNSRKLDLSGIHFEPRRPVGH